MIHTQDLFLGCLDFILCLNPAALGTVHSPEVSKNNNEGVVSLDEPGMFLVIVSYWLDRKNTQQLVCIKTFL